MYLFLRAELCCFILQISGLNWLLMGHRSEGQREEDQEGLRTSFLHATVSGMAAPSIKLHHHHHPCPDPR